MFLEEFTCSDDMQAIRCLRACFKTDFPYLCHDGSDENAGKIFLIFFLAASRVELLNS